MTLSTGYSAALSERLADRESVIEQGLNTFLEVGQALLAIRDERLYRESYDTFEEYCNTRWAMSRSRAYQVMAAAQITDAMSTFVDKASQPKTEAQARALTGLAPHHAAETMQVARAAAALTRGSTEPTAAELTETRAHLFGLHSAPVAQTEPPATQPTPPQPRPMTAAEINAITPPEMIAEAKAESARALPAFGIRMAIDDLLAARVDPAALLRDLPDYAREQLAPVPEALAYLTALNEAMETYR